jgi:hypothetical protein
MEIGGARHGYKKESSSDDTVIFRKGFFSGAWEWGSGSYRTVAGSGLRDPAGTTDLVPWLEDFRRTHTNARFQRGERRIR